MENYYLLASQSKPRQKRGCLLSLWRENWCPWLPARHVLAVMSFLGFVNVYTLRANLSVALLVMLNKTGTSNGSHLQPHPVRCV